MTSNKQSEGAEDRTEEKTFSWGRSIGTGEFFVRIFELLISAISHLFHGGV